MSDTQAPLPDTWELASLGAIMDRLQYGYTAKAQQHLRGPRFLRITDLQDNGVDWHSVPGCEASPEQLAKYRLCDGDFVFARSGSIEKAWCVEGAPDAVFASYLIRGRPLTPDVAPWLARYIRSLDYLEQIGAAGAGSGMTNVNAKRLGQVTFPLPPVKEQRRIVAKIDALQARSRRAREALGAIPALLDRFRQSVLAAAFRGDLTAQWRAAHPEVEPASILLERIRAERKTRWIEAQAEKARARAEAKATKAGKPWTAKDDAAALKRERAKATTKYTAPEPVDPVKEGLPELPKGWCWARWDQISVDVTVGFVGSMTKEYRDEGIPFLRSQNVRMDAFDSKGLKYITPLFHLQIYKSRLRANDLAVVRSGSVGTTCVIPESLGESNCSDLVIIQSPLGILPELGSYYMNSAATDTIRDGTVGVALTHYNTKSVAALPVPIPPEAEQRALLSIIRHQLEAAQAILHSVKLAQPRLLSVDQSILAKAFRGELVPQDPSDEPASELLKRIQAERAAAEATKPKRGRKKKSSAKAPPVAQTKKKAAKKTTTPEKTASKKTESKKTASKKKAAKSTSASKKTPRER